ncbi:MAG: PsbP-related protein [Patescibacteria group bacterium]
MTLPRSLTTVTTFSKILALFLFILLPFAGFYVGYKYRAGTYVPTPINLYNPTSVPTPTIDMTNWKTYTNNKLGFSIKYPQDFRIENNKQTIQFYSKDFISPKGEYGEIIKGGVITVTVFQTSNNLSKQIEGYKNNKNFNQFQQTRLGGVEAWRFLFQLIPGYGFEPKIIAVNSGKEYDARASFAKDDKEKINKIFDQMLSTFKYTQ